MPTTTIDWRALTEPMPESEVKAWKQKAKASGAPWATWQAGSIIAVVVFIPIVLFLIAIFGSMGALFVSLAGQTGRAEVTIVPAIIVIAVIAIIAFAIVKGVGSFGRRWAIWARMDKFAAANDMMFSPTDANPAYPGSIFQLGDSRQAVDHVRTISSDTAGARFIDFGNYRYTTGSGKNRSTRTWGFLAFHLDRRLPNMVLDSKANDGFFGSNLPATFDKSQILSLEGDFDRYFTLYCPKEYERDALYVFTPDLMALLIDEAAPFDVEIVDDWMFVYSTVPFQTADASMYARLFRIVDTVGAKTLTQTDRYVDERVGDFAANVVAPQGARLKRRVSVGAIIIGVVVIGFWIWGVMGGALQGLLR
jgi:hypothetical protein